MKLPLSDAPEPADLLYETTTLATKPDAEGLMTSPAPSPIYDMMRLAIEKGGDAVAGLETLFKLHVAMHDHNARLAFHEAMAAFQADCPLVTKSSVIDFTTKSGMKVPTPYATIEDIVTTIRPYLTKHGLSHTFDGRSEGAMHTETITVRHVGGHKECNAFTLPTATNSPLMSEQQRYASASSFAQRRCVIAAYGLALVDPDPGREVDPTPIDEHELANLKALMQEAGAGTKRVCNLVNVERLEDIRKADLTNVIRQLEAARKRGTP